MPLMLEKNAVSIDTSMTGVTREAGTTYPTGASEFTPSFSWINVSL